MAMNFIGCERGQSLVMPASVTEWLPDDHLEWTTLGAVEQMDLDRFYESYRLGDAGRPTYERDDVDERFVQRIGRMAR